MPVLVEISSLQSCLIQLNHISYRLSWANIIANEITSQLEIVGLKSNPEKSAEKLRAKSKMCLDYMFLNLHHLFEIHDNKLGKVIHEIGFDELIKSLKPLWNEIESLRDKIKLWRHNYVAHSTSQATDFKIFEEIDPDHRETIQKVFFVSRIACIFIHTIFENLPSDYRLSISLQKLRIKEMSGDWNWVGYPQYWEEMNKNEEKLVEETNQILTKNGFESTAKPNYFAQDLTDD